MVFNVYIGGCRQQHYLVGEYIMSTLIELRRLEAEIAQLQKRRDDLQTNPSLAKDIELRDLVVETLKEYDRSPEYLMDLLGVTAGKATKPTATGKVRRERSVKRYKNPHTGEVIETKGGNHKGLNEWKKAHGKAEVETWVQEAA